MKGFSLVWRRSGGLLLAMLLAVVLLPQAVAMATPGRAPAATQGSGDFPEGYFFIRNVDSGQVLDVKDGSAEPGASVVLWPRKSSGFDNQLWTYDSGFLVNKASGLVLEVQGYESGGSITLGTSLVQNTRREPPASLNQLWAYNYRHLMPYDPKVSLAGQGGDVSTPGVIEGFAVGVVGWV
ncbi:RICIN domain-containing protein [Streptomyces sp. NBC_00212]|uniref:RICIN domain-containing protein n=1 Tax=Streptomyces sp. NBC_00212 TaxID=2975684 RepID=UPI0032534D9B